KLVREDRDHRRRRGKKPRSARARRDRESDARGKNAGPEMGHRLRYSPCHLRALCAGARAALQRTLSDTGPPGLWATSKREPADQVTGDERESHGLHGMLGDVLACDVDCLVQHSHGALRLNSRARLRRERSRVCTLSHRLSGAANTPGDRFLLQRADAPITLNRMTEDIMPMTHRRTR